MCLLLLALVCGSPHLSSFHSRWSGAAFGTSVTPDPSPPAAPPAEHFVIKQLGRGFVKVGGAETDPEDIRLVEAAWAESAAAILSGDWDLVVLDEINYAIGYKMLSPETVADVLRRKPEMTHVILTGRNAHPLLVELADTVTRSEEHTSELQSLRHLVCRLLLEKKKHENEIGKAGVSTTVNSAARTPSHH